METLLKFIVIWKDTKKNRIYRVRTEVVSKKIVKILYGKEEYDCKLLYLFRVKSIKHG